MSPDADPNNPNRKWEYVAEGPSRDFSLDAIERAQKDPRYSGDNYSKARKWNVKRLDR